MNIAPAIYKRIIAGKLYMDQHFQDPIDLNSISRKACISRFHFHRLFTRVYNRTPHQYLTRKRIALACELLTDEKLSITDICNSIGFESMGSFSVLFKKEIGINPRSYRNNALLKKEQEKKSPDSFIPFCFLNACVQGQ
jgi:AraC-like DNA-binding protein